MSKRYYWLKLKHDFFEQQEVRIIEQMPNGKDYVLFYLKLLCKSVTTEGRLRFNEQIPYDEEMLSIITNMDVSIVREAVKVFEKFHMMEILEDGTYFMNEVEKMIGSETYWAQKKREQRSKEAEELENVPNKSNPCPQCPTKREDIQLDIHTEGETKAEETEIFSLSTKQFFSLEFAWNETVKAYPRKSNYGNAYEVWLEMIGIDESKQSEKAREIYCVVRDYATNYRNNNKDFPDGERAPGFGKWLKNEYAIWKKRRDDYYQHEKKVD